MGIVMFFDCVGQCILSYLLPHIRQRWFLDEYTLLMLFTDYFELLYWTYGVRAEIPLAKWFWFVLCVCKWLAVVYALHTADNFCLRTFSPPIPVFDLRLRWDCLVGLLRIGMGVWCIREVYLKYTGLHLMLPKLISISWYVSQTKRVTVTQT